MDGEKIIMVKDGEDVIDEDNFMIFKKGKVIYSMNSDKGLIEVTFKK